MSQILTYVNDIDQFATVDQIVTYVDDMDQFATMTDEWVTPTSQDAIYFSDLFDSDLLDKIMARYGKPACVITDVESTVRDCGVPVFFIPALIMGMSNHLHFFTDKIESIDTRYCFNFSINKKQLDRYCLLKLIEWFDLDSYLHTWSGIGASFDCAYFITEAASISASWKTEKFLAHLLSPVQTVKEHWLFPDPVDHHNNHNRALGDQELFMNHGLDFFAQSAVSLISESSTKCQPNFCFTEKTMLAMCALTFPIWVGSYAQAKQAETMGFDTFSDIINHDYQFKNTVLERCYHAVHDNLKLLTDLERVSELRQKHGKRLVNNRDYLMEHGFSAWVSDQIKKLPVPMQQQIVHLRGDKYGFYKYGHVSRNNFS